uniref:Alcohol acetyltransferase n=1 Tax=Kwoniella bestiolae CBS 10118 TaxID=1296100 RepID=A0A1B9GG29_9TREE|nr:hypothetical protein I302_01493 [Kwoniella bestiolae CBS 10118]OCF29976.1 hypothetical protein I302_01493 [Kwoniella bestiolae CBS 10118]
MSFPTPLTPPYTPLTDSSSPVFIAKSQFPAHPNAIKALLTPPQTPEFELRAKQEEGRKLSDNEISYYLPSRGDGVNDMYVHHKLLASPSQMTPSRILHIWAYQLLLHPLLSSTVEFREYEDISFVPSRPRNLVEALSTASERFSYIVDERDIIGTYLNGPRTLSNDRLGYLVVKGPSQSEGDEKVEYEFMLCATHYLGDGMALHSFMNEFYILLGSDLTTQEISQKITQKLGLESGLVEIPKSLEDRLPPSKSDFARIVGKEESRRSEAKLIGGQSFGSSWEKLPRHTVVPTISYDKDKTKGILGNCKKNGVTIAHAVFALCNIAWARKTDDKIDPCLIYSALNLRPNMIPSTSTAKESFFHLAVGYFNIVLPTLLPSSISTSELFWHRARMTKQQTIKAVKSPFVVARSQNTSMVRRERAVKWAKIDDEEELKSQQGNPGLATQERKVSQRALMGLSMLGNLDGKYKHAEFPSLELTSLTTGSRQRQGGLLLFAYTFAGKLWFSLGYDKNGFPPGVIEGFWSEVQNLIEEVLV